RLSIYKPPIPVRHSASSTLTKEKGFIVLVSYLVSKPKKTFICSTFLGNSYCCLYDMTRFTFKGNWVDILSKIIHSIKSQIGSTWVLSRFFIRSYKFNYSCTFTVVHVY